MYMGIDLGTSAVKVITTDEAGSLTASASMPLEVSRPHPLWSEQDPLAWWQATDQAVQALSKQVDLMTVKAIGLSGQMHGATLLGAKDEILRPAILWNDGRSFEQCLQLEAEVPDSRERTGNMMMPGFTAPKLKWVLQHEPDLFSKIQKVLLPKDYLRLKMTGEYASDMSDAAGTLWLNLAQRDWDDRLLEATHLQRQQMPKLYEGPEVTGHLSAEVAQRWQMQRVPVVAGASDNAAGALGVGIHSPGQAMLSLGTSGVYFAVSQGVLTNPEAALHSFCHALPNTWHMMSVILSAASCLDWVAKLTGFDSVSAMMDSVSSCEQLAQSSNVVFLPYLSGERTPHNDPNAKGVFFGMTHQTGPNELVQAVLEGVAFALADGVDGVHQTGFSPSEVTLIGGGARSHYWRQLLADSLGMDMTYRQGGDVGPGLGAARLAMLGVNPQMSVADCCPQPKLQAQHSAVVSQHHLYQEKRAKFKALYPALKELF